MSLAHSTRGIRDESIYHFHSESLPFTERTLASRLFTSLDPKSEVKETTVKEIYYSKGPEEVLRSLTGLQTCICTPN